MGTDKNQIQAKKTFRDQRVSGNDQNKYLGYRWVPGSSQKKIFGYWWVSFMDLIKFVRN